jgi:hypothetical protein
MKRGFLVGLLFLWAVIPAEARQGFPPASFAQPVQLLRSVDMVVLPPVDADALRAEDDKMQAEGAGGPARFAAPIPVALEASRDGSWETLPDGSRLWRLRVVSPGAYSLNFGFSRFRLPDGAAVYFYPAASVPVQDGGGQGGVDGPRDPDRQRDGPTAGAPVAATPTWDGPYESADASPDGQFWTAVVAGDDAVIELWVPADAAFDPELVIAQVGHDYRGFASLARALVAPGGNQGSCNNDVICPQGDPWRNEIRSVGCYSLGGSRICTGTLVNSHDPDHPPYFLTAYHCTVSEANAASIVVYWNYDSPHCGDLAGGPLAQHQTGSQLKARYSVSDFCLVRLTQEPDPAFNVYYTGWDAREATMPASAVCIHHPGCYEKAISFCNMPLALASYLDGTTPGDGTHWRVPQWDDGTTEPGSSGSGLWDASHHLVGQLHGGWASCTSITSDFFGRLSRSWEGGGVATSRLKTWLDPAGTGVLFVDGRNWDGCAAVPGNADCDPAGEVTTQDLVAIVNHILGTVTITGQGFRNADQNGDGRLSVVDLVAMVNIMLHGAPKVSERAVATGRPIQVGAGTVPTAGVTAPGIAQKEWRLEAGFDPKQRAVVFTMVPELGSDGSGSPAAGPEAGPAAISIVLAADPGAFALGPLPMSFPSGGGWQGLAMTTADGTVRAVLFDPEAGASGRPPSFALPVAGCNGDVRWVEGDAADGSAGAVRLEAAGFPVRIPLPDGGNRPARGTLAVQPNPARGACTLRFDLALAAEAAFTVHDPAGRVVLTRNLGSVAAGSAVAELSERDTAALAPGLYFVRLTLDGRHAGTARLIVAR